MKPIPCAVVLLITVAFRITVAVPLDAQSTESRSPLTIDVSSGGGVALTYASGRRDSVFLLGFGGGGVWELNHHSYDGEVWDVLHVEVFGRLQPTAWFQGEAGLSIAGTSPTDDTRGRRTFAGVYGAAMVGVGPLFVGPKLRMGTLGNHFGYILDFGARAVIS